MIEIKCNAPASIKLRDLKPFQGDLKKRVSSDVTALAASIHFEGLLMPFVIWKNAGSNYLLDGHGRLAALSKMATEDISILEQDFPCIEVEAEDEASAKKALLQITSQYGKVTKDGALHFCATIPEYHAPSIDKYIHKPISHKKVEQNTFKQPMAEVVLHIAVKTEKVEEVKELFSKVSYIRIIK